METPEDRARRYARADDFVRRVLEVAPDLAEDQLENIRRASAGDPPAYLDKPRRSRASGETARRSQARVNRGRNSKE